jgi:putative heme transporter
MGSPGEDTEQQHDGPPATPTLAPQRKHRPWWHQAISVATTVVVLVVVFGFVIPNLADYRDVLDSVGAISISSWLMIGSAALLFLIAYPLVLMQVLPTLLFREAFTNHMAGTAVTNAVPSGGAIALPVNYAMYMSWGFTPHAVSAGLLAAGVWDWLARIALPVSAVFGVALIGDALGWMWAVSIAGFLSVSIAIYLLIRLTRSETAARRFANLVARITNVAFRIIRRDPPNVEPMVMKFRGDLSGILRVRVYRLTATTIVNHAALTGLFVACVYGVGIERAVVPVPWVVLAFTLGRFLVMIPVSPGGLGLVDLGWIGLLTLGWQTASPGVPVDASLVSAAVLLFRALTLLPPIPIGMTTWTFWRFNTSWRRSWQDAKRGDGALV